MIIQLRLCHVETGLYCRCEALQQKHVLRIKPFVTDADNTLATCIHGGHHVTRFDHVTRLLQKLKRSGDLTNFFQN